MLLIEITFIVVIFQLQTKQLCVHGSTWLQLVFFVGEDAQLLQYWSNKPNPLEQLEKCAEDRQELRSCLFFCSRLESKVKVDSF